MAKQGKAKKSTVETLITIEDNCDNVLSFLQAVKFKSPRVIVAPLSHRADKRARVWFYRWTDVTLTTPVKPYPQDHMGLTGVLTNMANRLRTAEALRPVISS